MLLLQEFLAYSEGPVSLSDLLSVRGRAIQPEAERKQERRGDEEGKKSEQLKVFFLGSSHEAAGHLTKVPRGRINVLVVCTSSSPYPLPFSLSLSLSP